MVKDLYSCADCVTIIDTLSWLQSACNSTPPSLIQEYAETVARRTVENATLQHTGIPYFAEF